MGHSRIGKLPATRQWKAVVATISGGADAAAVAAATARAAGRTLAAAAKDPVLRRSIWLLTQIPLAARHDNYIGRLRSLGLPVSDAPALVEIGAAVTSCLDRLMKMTGRKNDFGEIVQTALVESLMATAGPAMASLPGLDDPAGDARGALKGLSTMRQFGVLARDFFARLIRRSLDYYLSRELPNHVGLQKRFHTLRDHRDFLDALDRHCRETALIVRDFAGEWFSKTEYQGGIDERKAGNFAHVAFGKITKELAFRAEAHA